MAINYQTPNNLKRMLLKGVRTTTLTPSEAFTCAQNQLSTIRASVDAVVNSERTTPIEEVRALAAYEVTKMLQEERIDLNGCKTAALDLLIPLDQKTLYSSVLDHKVLVTAPKVKQLPLCDPSDFKPEMFTFDASAGANAIGQFDPSAFAVYNDAPGEATVRVPVFASIIRVSWNYEAGTQLNLNWRGSTVGRITPEADGAVAMHLLSIQANAPYSANTHPAVRDGNAMWVCHGDGNAGQWIFAKLLNGAAAADKTNYFAAYETIPFTLPNFKQLDHIAAGDARLWI